MAEASQNSAQPMTTANCLQQLQAQNSTNTRIGFNTTESIKPQASLPLGNSPHNSMDPVSQSEPSSSGSALTLLQTAYNDFSKVEQDSPQTESVEDPDSKSSIQQELVVALTTLNKLDKDEQEGFIKTIQSTNPIIFKRMCPFLPIHLRDLSSDSSKRSPICISLSKEKSEQKIKTQQSGPLSPFSSRSAGVNPTVSESTSKIPTVVLDNDEHTGDEKAILDTKVESPKWKTDNDEDDDDYSFEDIYKAAQEKLQKQLNVNEKSVHSTTKTETETKFSSAADVEDDVTFVNEEKPSNIPPIDKKNYPEQDKFVQKMNIPSDDLSKSDKFLTQPPHQPANELFRETVQFSNPASKRQDETTSFKDLSAVHHQNKPNLNEFSNIYDGRHGQDVSHFSMARELNVPKNREAFNMPSQNRESHSYLSNKQPFNNPSNIETLNNPMNRESFNSMAIRGQMNPHIRAPYLSSDYSTFRPSQENNMYQMNQYQTGQPQYRNNNFIQTRPTMDPSPSARLTNPPQYNQRYSQYPPY